MELLSTRGVVLDFVAIALLPIIYCMYLDTCSLALGVCFAAINTKVDSPLRICDCNTA